MPGRFSRTSESKGWRAVQAYPNVTGGCLTQHLRHHIQTKAANCSYPPTTVHNGYQTRWQEELRGCQAQNTASLSRHGLVRDGIGGDGPQQASPFPSHLRSSSCPQSSCLCLYLPRPPLPHRSPQLAQGVRGAFFSISGNLDSTRRT
jgi:hypothetical protein